MTLLTDRLTGIAAAPKVNGGLIKKDLSDFIRGGNLMSRQNNDLQPVWNEL